MYNSYYGFKESPFSIAPNPRYLFMGTEHQEALAHLLYSLETRGGFVLLTGEVGTGKTTVTRCFLERMPEDTECAYILHPKMSSGELLAAICDELNIRYVQTKFTVKNYIDVIQKRLLENYAKGKRTFLVIDEAQNLSFDVLEQVRLLTNLETAETKLLQIILVGQPELREIFEQKSLRQLNQRITARFHLSHLTTEELPSYVKHRLRVAGAKRNPFTKKSVMQIYKLTGGIPRLVNVLCDRALLGGYVDDLDRITPEVVVRAAGEVFGNTRTKSFKERLSFLSEKHFKTIGLFMVGIVAYTLMWSWLGESPLNTLRYAILPAQEIRVDPELEAEIQRKMEALEASGHVVPLEAHGDIDQIVLDQFTQGSAKTIGQGIDISNLPMAEKGVSQQNVSGQQKPSGQQKLSEKQKPNQQVLNKQEQWVGSKPIEKLVKPGLSAKDAATKTSPQINSFQVLESSQMAFSRLLSYWGNELGDLGEWAAPTSLGALCKLVTSINLRCLKKVGDLSSVQLFNRPALLKINRPASLKIDAVGEAALDDTYVSLIGFDGTHVLLDSESGQFVWERSFLDAVWTREYQLLWRVPPDYGGLIHPGTEGQSVQWLNEQLLVLDKKRLIDIRLNENQQTYNEAMTNAIKIFQQSYGLSVDGLAGEQTLIYLNTLLDPAVPTLFNGPLDIGA